MTRSEANTGPDAPSRQPDDSSRQPAGPQPAGPQSAGPQLAGPQPPVDPPPPPSDAADPTDPTSPSAHPSASERRDHHATYFRLFSQPQVVRQLLELLSDEWVVSDLVDFDRLRRLPGQFVTAEGGRRRLDIAWMAPYGDDEHHLACVVEFQSSKDPDMPARINEYGHLTTDSLIREGHIERFGRLPHGLGLVIYNGEDEWDIKGSAGVDGPPPGPNGLPSREQSWSPFCLIDICGYAAERPNEDTLLVWLGLAEAAATPAALHRLLAKAEKRHRGPENAELRRALRLWSREKWKKWDESGPIPEYLDQLTMKEEADLMFGSVERAKEMVRAEARAEAWTEAKAEGWTEATAEYVAKVARRKPGADEERLSALLDVANGTAGNGALMDAALDNETFDDFEAAVRRLIKKNRKA